MHPINFDDFHIWNTAQSIYTSYKFFNFYLVFWMERKLAGRMWMLPHLSEYLSFTKTYEMKEIKAIAFQYCSEIEYSLH